VLLRRGIELGQGEARARHRSPLASGQLDPLIGHAGEIDDYSLAHVASAHATARASGNQRHQRIGCPTNERTEIVLVAGEANGTRNYAVNAGSFGIRRASP